MIEIDGSLGEGGGQVLRSALTLSLLTQETVRINNIRARRKKPGLRAQHLASVLAAKVIGRAKVEGAEMGSQELGFKPAGLFSGSYRFDIGTAGSCSLVLQTIFLPLSLAGSVSEIEITGGTHVPWSPTHDYIRQVWLPIMSALGYPGSALLEKAGFYPKGGGRIQISVGSVQDRRGLGCINPGAEVGLMGCSMIANLPEHVAVRQRRRVVQKLAEQELEAQIEIQRLGSPGKGSSVFISAAEKPACFGFSALGARGKPAEAVADEAIDQLLEFRGSGADVDRFLADQLLIPLSIARASSAFIVERVTKHLLTNAEVIRKFLPVEISVDRAVNGIGAQVEVTPADLPLG